MSEYYVEHIISVEDATDLAKQFHVLHQELKDAKNDKAMIEPIMKRIEEIRPDERPYMPSLSDEHLMRLKLKPEEEEEVKKK